MIEELSSLIRVIQLIIAPAKTPGSIIGTVTFQKDLNSVAPRLIAASSILGLICVMIAVLERIVYGIRRIAREIIMISAVPLKISGCLLKASGNNIREHRYRIQHFRNVGTLPHCKIRNKNTHKNNDKDRADTKKISIGNRIIVFSK